MDENIKRNLSSRPLGRVIASTLVLSLLSAACGSGATADGGLGGSTSRDGKDGTNGENGEDGANGKNGKDGKTGANGTNGTDGTDGTDGTNGTNGTDGTDGTNGTDGEDGVDGVTPGPVAIFGSVPKKKVVTTNASTFTFGCSAGDCDFEYSLDGAEYVATQSPLSLSGLAAGSHKVKVRAKSVDPADTLGFGATTSYSWTVRKPNILTIIADDLGYSDIGALGGEIDTPNLNALAKEGRLLARHHVGTVCAITRAMLISGTDHHRIGEGTMGAPNDERAGLPGYEGYLNDRSLSVAQLLKDGGYRTYISGKWHLGSRIVGGTSGSGKTPDQWGFDRSFSLLGGAIGNHFLHESATSTALVYDGKYSRPGHDGHPADGTFSADFFTDKLISFIDDGLVSDPDKPFWAYAAYLSPHWPLQAPDAWLNKYKGKYDKGYSPIAAERLRRLKDRGLLPESLTPSGGFQEFVTASAATANNGTANAKYINAIHSPADGYVDYGASPVIKNWENLNDAEKKAQARYMEIYAAMVDHLDYSIGRLIGHLKEIGEYEYTFISFHSDSGAEGWPNNSAAPQANDESYASDAIFPTLGTDNSGTANARRLQYGIRWAEVSNTPNSHLKGFQGVGGLTAPAIVHLPGQTEELPPIHHFTHITDETATILDLADVAIPSEAAPPLIEGGVDKNAGKVVYDGRYVYPVSGTSYLGKLTEESPTALHTTSFAGEAYGRAFILSADGKWRARWTEPPYGPIDGHWELFYIENDLGETTDLSALRPDILGPLVEQWKAYLASVGGVEPLRPRGYY